jgi:hypothetical protein
MGLKVSQGERKALEVGCDDPAHGGDVRTAWFDCGSLSNNVALAMAAGWNEYGGGDWLCPACAHRTDKRKRKAA